MIAIIAIVVVIILIILIRIVISNSVISSCINILMKSSLMIS